MAPSGGATMWRACIARTGSCLGDRIARADTFWSRFLGLMGRLGLDPGEGLLLTETSSVHMGFMRFPIDVLFLDEAGRVVAIRERLPPWTGFAMASAAAALELPPGTARAAGVCIGDSLDWTEAG